MSFYEVRACGWCYGSGNAYTLPSDPDERPELVVCERCTGSGEESVYLYPLRTKEAAS